MTSKVFLTDRYVRNAKATKTRVEIPDAGAPGLRLVVQPTGGKSWALRFRRPDGRPAKMTLGSVDVSAREEEAEPVTGGHLTLASARRLATEARRQLKLGRDPASDAVSTKKKRKWEAVEKRADTFGAAIRTFILREAKPKNSSWRQTASFWGLNHQTDELAAVPGGIADRWGSRPVSEITKADILKLRDSYAERGKRENIPHVVARRFFKWLEGRGQIERSPVHGLPAPDKAPARDRVLTDHEVRLVWRACDRVGLPFGPLVRMLLVTGQRRGEVAGMARSELSPAHDLWSLPPSRTKNGRAHTVPLTKLALEVLERPMRRTDKHDLIFTTNGVRPVSGFRRAKRSLDREMLALAREDAKARREDAAKVTLRPWRLHDLRRTVATGLQRLGYPIEITEAVLNHASGEVSGVAAVYARHDYANEKRAALEAWSRELLRVIANDEVKVLPLVGGPGLRRLRASKDAAKIRAAVVEDQQRARDALK
jgi:integrase